jgi:hypothetical protein
MASFQTNPYGIDELLPMLDKGRVVLPEFQRSFVWRPADVDLLLTSLVQGFPSGSLLFLKADASLELAWRPVELAPTIGGQVSPHYLVLDGQQRLTSLSVALNGRGDHVFMMDLARCDAGDLDAGIYAIRRDRAEARGLFDRERQFELHTFPLWAVVGERADDDWFDDYAYFHASEGSADHKSELARARSLRKRFVEPLKRYAFPVVELPSETSLEAVCQIFESLNKTGVRLTVFDLMTAKFWPLGLNLRDMYKGAREDYPLLAEFDVESVLLLQAISLLRTGLCAKGDLLKLEAVGFQEDWERVCAAASTALGVLRSECGVLTRIWLPYAALFPALFAVVTRVQQLKGPAIGAAWEKIKRWFWCSSIGQRYEGPQNTLNAADVRQLAAWIDHDDVIPEAVANFRIDELDLRRIERQRNAIYRSVICLSIVNGARDFHAGTVLTADVLNDPNKKVEDHHIFPTGYLRKAHDRGAENTILNRCLIDNVTNKLISDKPPSQYLSEVENHLGTEQLHAVLASHLIPTKGPGAPWNDDVVAFLDARDELLRQAIASVTGAELGDARAGASAYLDPSTPFTNELALRKVIRSLTGDVFWYEQHMSRKNLEPLAEEIDTQTVKHIRLLSGPANITTGVKQAYERFATELDHRGVDVEWRVLTADAARALHARVLFDDEAGWELPPLNSLYKGTVDSIRRSSMPRTRFEEAWNTPAATVIGEFEPQVPSSRPDVEMNARPDKGASSGGGADSRSGGGNVRAVARQDRLADFWTEFISRDGGRTRGGNVGKAKDLHGVRFTRRHLLASGGKRGLFFRYGVARHRATVDLYIDLRSETENARTFDALERERAEIEAIFGDALEWVAEEETRARRIECRFHGGYDDRRGWAELQERMIEAMIRLQRALNDRLDELVATAGRS